ncbi:TonB-dependent receptor plug domain-containing protein [Teredinibacter franksiae]|uniref:TonB-dependent receptor plug domain-containing protein n=1 Tax=Teredinibacter franksiae TaxID=2761453 RepID=UPI0016250286|nr:TonB-dependent receptor [Teredinibacter franksiae]
MKKTLIYSAVVAALYTHPSFSQDLLEEVIITASRNETPVRQIGASVSVINAEEIALANYPAITDLLRSQVGISASNSGGPGKVSSLRIRGEEGYRTLIMIDGVEISDPTGTQIGPQVQHLTNSGDIERIEILRGPQGFAYGADAGGVINIFSRSVSEGVAGQVSAQAGRYGTQDIDGFVAAGSDRYQLFLSASDKKTDGFNARTSDESNESDGYENRTLHGKLAASNAQENLRFQVVFRDVNAESEFDNCGYPSSNDCVGEFEQTTARASIDYTGDDLELTLGSSNTAVERTNFTDGDSSFATKGKIRKHDIVISSDINDSVTLVAGSDLKGETMDVVDGDDLNRDQMGLFSELQLGFNDSLYFSAGARYDDHDDFGEHVSLRLTSAYIGELADSSYKLRASFGNGFRAPSLSELAYNQSDSAFGLAAETELNEEQSQGFDIGFDYFFSNASSLEFTYFNQSIENEIFFDLVAYSGYLQGDGTSHSSGKELAFNMPLADWVEFKLNGTLNDTETSSQQQRIRRPEKAVNAGFIFTLLDNDLNIRTNYRISKGSVNEIYELGRIELDDYQLLDISANYAILKGLNLFGRVDNVLNEQYEEVTGFNTSGVAAYAGVRYEY